MTLVDLIEHASRDPALRRELLRDPKRVIERALGVTLPSALVVHVHEETEQVIHLVLPQSSEPAPTDRSPVGS